MAEESGAHSRYVKLTEEQAAAEDIKPGELNQPNEVPQLAVRKCNERGQPMPENFEPPADEPWTTGIFGCAEDTDSCLVASYWQHQQQHFMVLTQGHHFLFARVCFLLGGCVACILVSFGNPCRKKNHLRNSPCDPCMVPCCMHWFALCQEHREMKGRLSDNSVMPMTVVNPPRVQEMTTATENQESTTSEKVNNSEMQAL